MQALMKVAGVGISLHGYHPETSIRQTGVRVVDEITAIAALVGGVIFAALSIFLRRKKGTVVEDNSATLEAHEEKIAEHKAEANVLKAENEVLNAKVDAIATGLAKDLEEADADAKKAGHAADDDPARALADAFNSASE